MKWYEIDKWYGKWDGKVIWVMEKWYGWDGKVIWVMKKWYEWDGKVIWVKWKSDMVDGKVIWVIKKRYGWDEKVIWNVKYDTDDMESDMEWYGNGHEELIKPQVNSVWSLIYGLM